MQAFLSVSAVLRGKTQSPSHPRNRLRRLAGFIAHDRDRWVPVVCATGFALLMWVDWLAA